MSAAGWRRLRRPLVIAAGAVVVVRAGRRLRRPKQVEAADWCPDLVLARLAKRRTGDGVSMGPVKG